MRMFKGVKRPKGRVVVADANLPYRFPALAYALIYGLYSHVYNLPAWLDYTASAVIAFVIIGVIVDNAKKIEIKILDESDIG